MDGPCTIKTNIWKKTEYKKTFENKNKTNKRPKKNIKREWWSQAFEMTKFIFLFMHDRRYAYVHANE